MVHAWRRRLEAAIGVSAAVYPSRHNKNELRCYFDVDDRHAAAIVEKPDWSAPGPKARLSPVSAANQISAGEE